MTKDAKKVIKQGFMFRCNSAGATGNGLIPFENCLQYETEELGNRDIYYTIRDIYSIYVDMRKSPKRINPVVLKAAANYFRMTGCSQLCGIWGCANQHQVEAYYGDPDQKIELPDNVFVASDLGPEGVLVVAQIKSWREKI